MASTTTKTVQNVMDWATSFLGWLPLSAGTNHEPTITSANIVLQTVLSPPFRWAWNRATATFTTTAPTSDGAGTQDYEKALQFFGFIEKATITDSDGNTKEIQVSESPLGEDTIQGQPDIIAVQSDDKDGNITFRLMKVPDAVYTVTITYQQSCPAITGTDSTWTPIPDRLALIYQWGFLALMLEYKDSSKAARMRQLFVATLLSQAEGLSESDRNLFISAWLGALNQEANAQTMQQLGGRAKGI